MFYEENLGSKLYMYKYINDNNEIKTVMKCKGLKNEDLKEEFYYNETGNIEFTNMKKIKFHVNSNEKKKVHLYLSIYNYDMKRAFNLNEWGGR